MKTKDLPLISTFYAFNFTPESIENVDGKIWFHFEETQELIDVKDGHYNGTLEVKPLSYFNAIKTVKRIIYMQGHNEPVGYAYR